MQRDLFLGTGWGFPVTFQKPENGECSVRMVKAIDDIAESLNLLFSTRPGERVLRPDYGASLEDLLFEPANGSLLAYTRELIRQAILFYEPRIIVQRVDIITDQILEGTIQVDLVLTVRSTNNRFNYVYDYYLREATVTPL